MLSFFLPNMKTKYVMEGLRTFDFINHQLRKYPLKNCLNYKMNGQWKSWSTQEVVDISRMLSLGLLHLGVKPGDKVAIISQNRPEWSFVDLACQQIGIVTVPLYPTITVRDYEYIFDHASIKAVFVENSDLALKVIDATKDHAIEHIFSFDDVHGVEPWSVLLGLDTNSVLDDIDGYCDSIRPDDLLTIIYTSGTTGYPKGVMLTHANLATNVVALTKLIGDTLVQGQDRALSFLPMCHIFERVAIYFYMYFGMDVYYAESMETIGENMRETRPHIFTCVPRLLEKVYDKIVAKGQELPWPKRQLFNWALRLGLKFDPNIEFGWWYRVQLALARKLIFSKWREALGGEVKLVPSGAAALQPRLARVFWAANIPIFEGYGLTETSPAISMNSPARIRIGTVGQPIENVEVRVAEDGEILCKGPNVMMGYYKNEELTKEVLKDGWFHTGDIGVLEDGYIRITDRKKEMFKTSGGKYIAPQLMENKFKESQFIEQIMVLGEGMRFPSALIVPNFETLSDWCSSHNVVEVDPKQLIKHPKVQGLYQVEVKRYNSEFGNWEQIKRFELVEKAWGVETGELTPTLKLKRRIIKEKFKELIEGLYNFSK